MRKATCTPRVLSFDVPTNDACCHVVGKTAVLALAESAFAFMTIPYGRSTTREYFRAYSKGDVIAVLTALQRNMLLLNDTSD